MDHGIVTDWEDMEKVWHHVFDELGVNPTERNLLMSEAVWNPNYHREKMAQVMFEKFGVPGLYIASTGVLTNCSAGRTICLTLEVGDGVTYTYPVYEGCVMTSAIKRLDMGGRDLTNYLAKLLMDSGYAFVTTSQRETVREIKEKLGFVSQDFSKDLNSPVGPSLVKDFELPDGQTIRVGKERFQCTEALFQPSLMGLNFPGIHQLVYDCIMDCEIDTRKHLYCNILPMGATSLFPGLADRLQTEMVALLPNSTRNWVLRRDYGRFSVWIGGSIQASLSFMRNEWMTKAQYDEYGPELVHRKMI